VAFLNIGHNQFRLLWFIYVFFFLLYLLVNFVGGDAMPVLNKVLFVIVIFGVLQVAIGAAMYTYINHDKVCTGTGTECMMLQVNHSYPFEGVISLIKHFINKDLFNNVHNLQVSNSFLVKSISGIPDIENIS